jgi:hypothetical protein
LLMNADSNPEFELVKLGKTISLEYIPFSELAIPWNVCHDTNQDDKDIKKSGFKLKDKVNSERGKVLKILKNHDFNSLKHSIARFGLLKPFGVAEMQERLDFFYGKGRYLVIDGQRRYFAIRELLNLPTEEDEKKQRDRLQTNFLHDCVAKAETQAQKQFERLSIRNHVMIPCIVYPYATLLQMVRHSIEDKRFSEKPPKEDLELAEKMVAEGIYDLEPDDLRNLWKIRSQIEKDKKSIEKTLQEIKNRMKNEPKNGGS